MKFSISEFLGFTDEEIYEIVGQEKGKSLRSLSGVTFDEKNNTGKRGLRIGQKILVGAN